MIAKFLVKTFKTMKEYPPFECWVLRLSVFELLENGSFQRFTLNSNFITRYVSMVFILDSS